MRSVRLALGVVMALVVSGCGGDGSSTTETAADADSGFFTDLDADWGAARVDERSYGVEISFNGSSGVGDVIADIGYPGYDCAGTLTLLSVDGDVVEAREHITLNPGDICTDAGLVRLERTGSTIAYEWSYPSGQLSDTATLTSG